MGSQDTGFKADQMRYPRVRTAYEDKNAIVEQDLQEKDLERDQLHLYIRIFKLDGILELWGRNQPDTVFIHIKNFEVCARSGNPGPKRQQGDFQVPEGFYTIDRFNPTSRFYLSLGVDYPNPSDRILGDPGNPGGDIFIHGACVTIGCVPITDDGIKELYIYCVEARNNGQQRIPVTIFPARMDSESYQSLIENPEYLWSTKELWEELRRGYDIFQMLKRPPEVTFLDNGRHGVQ
jgi:murein L,D-transpeptidase YafK